MKQLYSTDNVTSNEKQCKLLLAIYIIVAVILVAGIVSCIVIYANEPFMSPKRTPLLVTMCVIAVVMVIFSFFYFSMIYNPVKKYVDYLKYTVFGSRNKLSLTVLDVFYQPIEYRGLNFYRISTLEWNSVRNDFVERIVLVDEFIMIDDLKNGDIINCELASSCLVAYGK